VKHVEVPLLQAEYFARPQPRLHPEPDERREARVEPFCCHQDCPQFLARERVYSGVFSLTGEQATEVRHGVAGEVIVKHRPLKDRAKSLETHP
jgi:hypothetical protein